MSKLDNLVKVIEIETKKNKIESKEPLDNLLYDTIIKTLIEMADNYKDDFSEQVVLNLLISGDDEGYSNEELREYINKINK